MLPARHDDDDDDACTTHSYKPAIGPKENTEVSLFFFISTFSFFEICVGY